MTQLERTRSSVVMNINESHYSSIPWDKEGEGSRGVSGGPAQGGDVGTTMERQCPVEDPRVTYHPSRVLHEFRLVAVRNETRWSIPSGPVPGTG